MSKLNNKKEKAKGSENLIILCRTRKITSDDAGLPEWDFLKEEYSSEEVESTADRLVVSLANSCIQQRKVIFCLARRSTQDLLKNDGNWSQGTGFKNEDWSSLRRELINREIIKERFAGSGQQPSIYELVSPAILEYIIVDKEKQYKEAVEFINKLAGDTEGTTMGTSPGDRVLVPVSVGVLVEKGSVLAEPLKKEEDKPSIRDIVASWKGENGGLDSVSGKIAAQTIPDLVETIKHYGYSKDEVYPKNLVKWIFADKATPKNKVWMDDIEGKLIEALAIGFQKVTVKAFSGPNPAYKLSPEERVLFDRWTSEGKTPANFNGLSLEEAAIQRVHANSFTILNTKELEEKEPVDLSSMSGTIVIGDVDTSIDDRLQMSEESFMHNFGSQSPENQLKLRQVINVSPEKNI